MPIIKKAGKRTPVLKGTGKRTLKNATQKQKKDLENIVLNMVDVEITDVDEAERKREVNSLNAIIDAKTDALKKQGHQIKRLKDQRKVVFGKLVFPLNEKCEIDAKIEYNDQRYLHKYIFNKLSTSTQTRLALTDLAVIILLILLGALIG